MHLGQLGIVGNLLRADRVHARCDNVGFSKLWQLQFRNPEPHADVLVELHMGLVGLVGDVHRAGVLAGFDRRTRGFHQDVLHRAERARYLVAPPHVQFELHLGFLGRMGLQSLSLVRTRL